jgi:hypothetical protein
MALGWRGRCERVGTFGPLEVERLARSDLIVTKVMSSPSRPQDLEDLRDMRPMPEELDFVEENLDRLESEHLSGESFEDQREVVAALRGH